PNQFGQQLLLLSKRQNHFQRRWRKFFSHELGWVTLRKIHDENQNPNRGQPRPNPAARRNQFAPNQQWKGCRVGDPEFWDGDTPSLPNKFSTQNFTANGVEFRRGGLVSLQQNFTRRFHN